MSDDDFVLVVIVIVVVLSRFLLPMDLPLVPRGWWWWWGWWWCACSSWWPWWWYLEGAILCYLLQFGIWDGLRKFVALHFHVVIRSWRLRVLIVRAFILVESLLTVNRYHHILLTESPSCIWE